MAIEYRSNNRARLTVYAGKDINGNDIIARKTISYINKKDAKEQYDAFVQEVRSGSINAGNELMVLDLCNRYIASMERKGRKGTTISGYRNIVTRIEKTLGNPKARTLTPYSVDQYVDKLAEQFSPKTIRNTIFFLSSCYKHAIKMRMLTQNPFDMVELPPMEHNEKQVLKADELVPFLEALRTSEDKDFVVAIEIALFCGLRRSEILALTEADVDLVGGTISVNKSRHIVDHESVIQTTKTRGSNRIIAMPKLLVQDINNLIKLHKEKSLSIREYQRSEFLIRNSLGEPYAPYMLSENITKFERRNNLPAVTLHGLRHTHASLVNYLGHDMMEISKQMGHSQLSTTMDIYTHLMQEATASSRSIAKDIDMMISV